MEILNSNNIQSLLIANEGLISSIKKFREDHKIYKEMTAKSNTPAKQKSSNSNDNEISIGKKIMELYPDEWNKEYNLRLQYLRTINTVINGFSTNIPGITNKDTKNQIKSLLNDPNYYDIDDSDYDPCLFLKHPLPGGIQTKEFVSSWPYLVCNIYYVQLFSYDIWNYMENCKYKNEFKNNQRNIRDPEHTKEYQDALEKAILYFKNKLSSSNLYLDINCGGDWDDGTFDLILKPSDQFLKFVSSKFPNFKYRIK